MPLETATYISQLNASNPAHTDSLNAADAHDRLIKSAVKNTFPNFTAAPLTSTQAQIDAAVATDTNGATKLSDTGAFFNSDPNTGISTPSADKLDLKAGGQVALEVASDKSTAMKGDASVAGDFDVTGGITGTGSVPIGGGIIWFSDTLPGDANWAWANGQAISRTTYASAFAFFGTKYGAGNGTTTFNLPDLRDNVPVGKSTMGGTTAAGRITAGVTGGTANVLGNQIGEDQHKLVTAELPAHKHTLTDPGHSHDLNARHTNGVEVDPTGNFLATLNLGSTGGYTATATPLAKLNAGAIGNSTTGITMANAGTDAEHNNVQPSLVCNWVIRIL
jgi:microcystin-dependent protein